MNCIYTATGNTQRLCKAKAMIGSDYCYFHNPDVSIKEKRLSRKKGGMNRAALQDTPLQEIKINCPGDVIYLLVDTINQVRAGSMDARIANCLGVLSSHLLRAMEHGEMQESLARIEEYIQQTA